MTDPFRCPSCKSRPVLRDIDPERTATAPLWRCDSCLGIWANSKAVSVAVQHYGSSHYSMVVGHGRQKCRECGVLLGGSRAACPSCNATQTLPCVQCGAPTSLVEVASVVVDVCRPCRAAWFDRGELGVVARQGSALSKRIDERYQADGSGVVSTVIDAVDLAPVPIEAAHAAGRAVIGVVAPVVEGGGAASALAAAGEMAVEAGAATAEVAGAAGEWVLEVVAAIFSS